MAKAMIAKPSRSLRQARTASIVAAACALAALLPADAQAAGVTTDKALGITIPASARVHSATTATTPTTSVPASTTPASATTSTFAPTGAGQPGTVVPPTTTPASAATQTASTTTSAAPATTPAPATGSTTVIVAHKAKPGAKRLSTGALALAILGALLVLGCIAWALGRWLALEPRWSISLMHSLREAAYRASETWAEFGDWARLGR